MTPEPRADFRSDDLIHERPERDEDDDRRIDDYLQRQEEARQKAKDLGPCPACGTNGPHYCPADIARD